MKKSGQPAQEGVDKGVAQCIMKSGTLGIIVKIMHSDIRMGDTIVVNHEDLAKAQKKLEADLRKTKVEKDLEIIEETREPSEEEKDLFEEVEEEEISEISLAPEVDTDIDEKSDE
ncbi:MAG: hypothetical protein ACTSO6_07335 [Promethearchaeota archaeon]